MLHEIMPALLTVLTSLAASTGFWAFLQKKGADKISEKRLLKGLAYARIMTMGMEYIERGWISRDEYEDFRKYLYEPYSALGGNGTGERIMQEVSKLPFRAYKSQEEES